METAKRLPHFGGLRKVTMLGIRMPFIYAIECGILLFLFGFVLLA